MSAHSEALLAIDRAIAREEEEREDAARRWQDASGQANLAEQIAAKRREEADIRDAALKAARERIAALRRSRTVLESQDLST